MMSCRSLLAANAAEECLLVSVEMLSCVAQHGARHSTGVFFEERDKPVSVSFASFPEPTADSCVDEVVLVVNQDFSDRTDIVQLALAYKERRCNDCGSTFPYDL